MITDLHAAIAGAQKNRAGARAALNDLFRAGTPPVLPLNGRYSGAIALIDAAPGLTQLVEAITSVWLPWKGKTFDSIRDSGDNIFTRDSLFLARLFTPFYRGRRDDQAGTYRAFTFRTYVAAGMFDQDRQVLKIDYDLPDNPSLTIRRVLDELVYIGDGAYLGKAHLHWWSGAWQTVAYFVLESPR